MSSKPSRDAIEKTLRSFAPLLNIRGGPRKLLVAGDKLYFLDGFEGKLFVLDVAHLTASTTTSSEVMLPAPVNIAVALPAPRKGAPMSKEEELLRERLRNTLTGISDFRLVTAPVSGDELMFIYAGPQTYLATRDGQNVRDVIAELKESTAGTLDLEGAWMDWKHQDEDPFNFSFILKNNIYSARINPTGAGGVVKRLTTVGTEHRTCGVADYIMQEEFSQYSAQFWGPGVSPRLLFTATDVTQQRYLTLLGNTDTLERIPFPRVGDPNASVSLVVTTAEGADPTSGAAPQFAVLPAAAIAKRFPWAEYITRLYWRDERTVYAVLLSRDQERCAHVEIPISAFRHSGSSEQAFFGDVPVADVEEDWPVTVVREQSIPWAWVEVTNDIFLNAAGNTIDVVGASDSTETDDASGRATHFQIFVREDRQAGAASHWRRVTSDDFTIKWSSITVMGDWAYFLQHRQQRDVLARVHLLENTPPQLLSAGDEHVSQFTVAPSNVGVVYVSSTPTRRLAIRCLPLSSSSSAPPHATPRTLYTMSGVDEVNAYPNAPTFGSVINRRGVTLPITMHLPQGDAPAAGWPLMLYVYGGPHVQLSRADFASRCDPVISSLLSFGVAVVVADNQMANFLGLRAHAICKHRMGRFETDDYRDVVTSLLSDSAHGGAKFDASRVGVYGWSYGGYATLLCMSQAADVFKLGISGAPVGDWLLYDTGYTERYMGLLPQHEPDYVAGSVATYAAGFPDDLNRVFIAHGTTDENVHFTNTMKVVDAMIASGKPYSLLMYPGERHGLRQKPASRRHFEISLLQIVLANL